jgi:hypothetical protein
MPVISNRANKGKENFNNHKRMINIRFYNSRANKRITDVTKGIRKSVKQIAAADRINTTTKVK